MSIHQETCSYCANQQCDAEWCDVDVGFVQMSPFRCGQCHAVEIGAYDKTVPTESERAAGGYAPGRLPNTVSSVNGCMIATKVAMQLYEAGTVPHVPFHVVIHDPGVIEAFGFSAPSSGRFAEQGSVQPCQQ